MSRLADASAAETVKRDLVCLDHKRGRRKLFHLRQAFREVENQTANPANEMVMMLEPGIVVMRHPGHVHRNNMLLVYQCL